MTKVVYSSGNNYNVKFKSSANKIKTIFESKINILPQKLDELEDVEISEVNGAVDKYVLIYDAVKQKWVSQNPDSVLIAAATEPSQPGLPTAFVNEVNQNLADALDNMIDIDGGIFEGG